MKIIVFSDSHSNFNALYSVVMQNKDADLFLHLGDGAEEFEDLQSIFPTHSFEGVCGNCDVPGSLPISKTIECAGKKIFMTHGHAFGVRYGTKYLEKEMLKNGADICLFGHTHIPFEAIRVGRYIMNPGSVSQPRQNPARKTYGIIEISKSGEISIFHKEVTHYEYIR